MHLPTLALTLPLLFLLTTALPSPKDASPPPPPAPKDTNDLVPAPSTPFPITQPCLALPTYQGALTGTHNDLSTKSAEMQALELKQKLCHGCLTKEENQQHGKLDWDVRELGKVAKGQEDAVKCLQWMCGDSGKGVKGHEVVKGGQMLGECVVLE